jgi:methyl-accepting chemotaxis protein
MGNIVASVQQVNEIIERISLASTEQADGIAEVNRAVGQMDDMTQQNAALVEQAAAAAESLADQTVNLSEAVAIFKIDGVEASGAADEDDGEPADEFREPQPRERRSTGSPMRPGARRALPDATRPRARASGTAG